MAPIIVLNDCTRLEMASVDTSSGVRSICHASINQRKNVGKKRTEKKKRKKGTSLRLDTRSLLLMAGNEASVSKMVFLMCWSSTEPCALPEVVYGVSKTK